MRKKNMVITGSGIVIVSCLVYLVSGCQGGRGESIRSDMFSRLKKVRDEAHRSVVRYFESIHDEAFKIRDDEKMRGYFLRLLESGGIADAYLEFDVDLHYVNNYNNFYDILFVDSTGYVFHSIKQESDYHKNLFEGPLSESRLTQRLQMKDRVFVEYDFYAPSGEPSAFFAIRVNEDDRFLGWFVLQTASNRINHILSQKRMGSRTGEVYLVNKDKLMVSDSRFIEDSTILKLLVDTDVVRSAFELESGQRIIEDYRGVRVYSCFKRFEVFNSTWIIIAEIDEDEVITEFYKRDNDDLAGKMCDRLREEPRKTCDRRAILKDPAKIDMNEYGKAEGGQGIYTYGISTCTGIAIQYPGRFTYMVHIVAGDRIYEDNGLISFFRYGEKSDMLGGLIRRIFYYNLYQSEIRNLRFVIAAPHSESIHGTLEVLLENGVELSQVKFAYNPDAISANLHADTSDDAISVSWSYKGYTATEDVAGIPDLGSVLKSVIEYDGTGQVN